MKVYIIVLILLFLSSNSKAQRNKIDTIFNKIEKIALMNYDSLSPLVDRGSAIPFNDTLMTCITFKVQPNYIEAIPLIDSLLHFQNPVILEKADSLLIKLVRQYGKTWTNRAGICRYLDVPEIDANEKLLFALQTLRFYQILLKENAFIDYKVYQDVKNLMNKKYYFERPFFSNIEKDSLKNCLDRKIYDKDLLNPYFEKIRFKPEGSFGISLSLEYIIKNKVLDWKDYIKDDFENANFKDDSFVNRIDVESRNFIDCGFVHDVLKGFKRVKSSYLNNTFFNHQDFFFNTCVSFEIFQLMGETKEIKFKRVLEENFNINPNFFTGNDILFNNFIYSIPGKQIANEFLLEKLKTKLSEEQRIVCYIALGSCPSPSSVNVLLKSFKKEKKFSIKKTIHSALWRSSGRITFTDIQELKLKKCNDVYEAIKD